MLIISQLLAIAYFGDLTAAVNAGYGRHLYYLNLPRIIQTTRFIFISEVLSNVTVSIVKISVALFLLRIDKLRKWHRISLIATIAFLISATCAIEIIIFIQCRPIAAN